MNQNNQHASFLLPGSSSNGKAQSFSSSRPPIDDKSIDVREIWYAIRQGKWIILLTMLLITATAVAYTLLVDPVYEATSLVSIGTGGSRSISLGSSQENTITFGKQHSLSSELGILQNSVELAEQVIQRLEDAADVMETDHYFPILRPKEEEVLSRQQIVVRMTDHVKFQSRGEQNMIMVTAESTSPEEAASIANFYAEEYEKYGLESSRASVVAARTFLAEQVQKRGAELQRLENQWEVFAREKEVITQGQAGERAVAEYAALSARRDDAQLTLEQELVSINLLQQQLKQVEPTLEENIVQERTASGIASRLDALDQKLAQLRVEAEQFYAVTPELRGNEALDEDLQYLTTQIKYFSEQKATLTKQYVDEVSKNTTGVEEEGPLGYINQLRRKITEKEVSVRELGAQINALDARLLSYEARLQGIPRQTLQREQLERKLTLAEQWYNAFVQQFQQVSIAEESELGYVKIVKRAYVPSFPVRPNVKLNIILGFLLGIGLGTGLAFARQATRTKLRKPQDLVNHGYPLIGVVPRMDKAIKTAFGGKDAVEVKGKLLSTRLITYLDPWSPVAENFQLIRANIQFAHPERPIQSLLITSPEVDDGKSVTTVNMAIAMAQAGRSTLLIDADLRRPDVHKLLGLERTPGLVEILNGKCIFNKANFATDIPGLYCIPAGHIEGLPSELFGTENVEHFLDSVRPYFDIIIIDSPPVLVVTDAVLLASQCDATAIVVTADKTDMRALDMTQETLSNLGVSIVGTIINRFDEKKVGGYKYAYQYYGDYHYGTH